MTMSHLFRFCTVMVVKSVLVYITASCECNDQQPGYPVLQQGEVQQHYG